MIPRNVIFEIVRQSISSMTEVSVDEITKESHIYRDLDLDSHDIVELIFSIEWEFNVMFPTVLLDDELFNNNRRQSELFYEKILQPLGFSRDIIDRLDEIENFSRKYDIIPFSVEFFCICIEQILRMRDLISKKEIFEILKSKINGLADILLTEITYSSQIYSDLNIDAEQFLLLINDLEEYFLFISFPEQIRKILIDKGIEKKIQKGYKPSLSSRLFKTSQQLEKHKAEFKSDLNVKQFENLSKKRQKEVDIFSKKYGVTPFSIEFICKCVEISLQM
jgi:acyl carrier protein